MSKDLVPSMRDEWPLEARAAAVFEEQSQIVRASRNPLVGFILGTAPWTGGLGSLLAHNAAVRQEIRLKEFLVAFAKEFDKRWVDLSERLDPDVAESDRFSADLAFALAQVAETDDEDRVRFLRDYLISAALKEQPDKVRIAMFRSYLAILSGAHLAVLSSFYSAQRRLARVDRLGRVPRIGIVPLDEGDISHRTGLNSGTCRIVLPSLESHGLLVDWHDLGNDIGIRVAYALSDMGCDLMRYLTQEWRGEHDVVAHNSVSF